MKNVKNNKGITLMALVITIILLIILASVGTYSGIQVVKSAQFTAFSTELKIMQTQVNKLYDEKRNGNDEYVDSLGEAISSNSDAQIQANIVFKASASGITDQNGYKYFDTKTIKSLNIEGVEGEFFVNIDKRSAVSYDGFEYEGTTYYTLEQLPDSLYNVEYNSNNNWDSSKDSFDIEYNEVEEGKYRITVSNINYKSGNINKWQVKYKKENEEDWKQSNNYSFIIDEVGKYRVKLTNNNFESNEKQIVIISSSLPSEFQKVEYIRNTETQYIDTGYIPDYTKDIDIEIDFTPSALDRRYCLLSNFSTSRHLSLELQNNKERCYYNGSNVDSSIGTMSTTTPNVYSFNYDATNKKYNLTFNNETKTGNMNATGTSEASMLAFVDRDKRFSVFNKSIKIHSIKISENGILIRKFVPCYSTTEVTDVNGVTCPSATVGLYDAVEGQFYTNQGTGVFYIPPERHSPSKFQQVQYIENTGTQYIDTGFIPDYTKNIDIEVISTPSVLNSRYCLLSNYSTSRHLSLELQNNKGRCYYNDGNVDSSIGTMSTTTPNVYLFSYDATNKKYNLTFNNETKTGNMNATETSGASMLAFVDQAKRYGVFNKSIKIHSIKISENGILIRKFVPCYSTTEVTDVNGVLYPSNKIGLYDTVEGKFYTNQGTDEFIKGDKINN